MDAYRQLIFPLNVLKELRVASSGFNGVTYSKFQADVKAVVCTLGLNTPLVTEEFETMDGFSIDVALPELRIAIEADGPHHFNRRLRTEDETGQHTSTSRWDLVPDGHTTLRHRALAAARWHVVKVPYFEWRLLPGRDGRRQYLQDAIDTVKISLTAHDARSAAKQVAEEELAEVAAEEAEAAAAAAAEAVAAVAVATEVAAAEKAAAEAVAAEKAAAEAVAAEKAAAEKAAAEEAAAKNTEVDSLRAGHQVWLEDNDEYEPTVRTAHHH